MVGRSDPGVEPGEQIWRLAVRAFVWAALIVLTLGIVAGSMTKPPGRDEHMYCTAGAMVAQGKVPYRDFCYVAQLPYHPLLLGGLYKMLDTDHYLLIGRLVSAGCDILVMLCLVAVYRRAFGREKTTGWLMGLCAAVLYVYNPLVDYANGYAWNNDVVILCVVGAFGLFTKINPGCRSRYAFSVGMGVLLSLACWMRMTTALPWLFFLVMLFSIPVGGVKERLKMSLGFLSATVVISLYPLWVIAQARQAFFIDVFRIHMLNSQWLAQRGMTLSRWKLITAFCLKQPGYAVLLLLAVYAGLFFILNRRERKTLPGRTALAGALLPVIFFVIALSLPTIWRQYLAMPVPFLIIALAYPLAFAGRLKDTASVSRHVMISRALVVVCTLTAVFYGPNVLERISLLFNTDYWVPVQVHAISSRIVQRAKEPKRILTASPLFAIEGGGDIYTEFSAGVFAYRIDEMMTPAQRRITQTAGPKDVTQIIGDRPPCAVILGAEPSYFSFLEEPFKTVIGPGWLSETYSNGLTVYYSP